MEFPNQKQIYKSDRIYIISINNLHQYLLFNVGWYCKFCLYTFNASSFNYSIAPNIHFQYAKCIGNETHTNIFQYNSVTDFKKVWEIQNILFIRIRFAQLSKTIYFCELVDTLNGSLFLIALNSKSMYQGSLQGYTGLIIYWNISIW